MHVICYILLQSLALSAYLVSSTAVSGQALLRQERSSLNAAARSASVASDTGCPPDSWPALAEDINYTAKGTVSSIGDLPIYHVGEAGPKAVIVAPEVFGWAGRLKGIR